MRTKIIVNCIFLVLILRVSNFSSAANVDSPADFMYDGNGNMVSDGRDCYTYNDANHMTAVHDCATDTLTAKYVYDHSGRRLIEKHFDEGVLTETVYTIGKHSETVVDGQGNQSDTTYYRANNELIAKKNPDGTLNFYHQDHLGSTGLLTDEAGQVVESTTYYPYGALQSGGTKGRYMYTGQEADAETGLYYYGSRFYNPELQRFVAADSILPDLYDPQQLSRYTYVRNNPLIYTDPTGHSIATHIQQNWDFWFGDYDTIDPAIRRQRDAFWLGAAQYSDENDTSIRGIAEGVRQIPVVGDLYATNILGATGKMEQSEFVTRQTVNSASAIASIYIGGSAGGSSLEMAKKAASVHQVSSSVGTYTQEASLYSLGIIEAREARYNIGAQILKDATGPISRYAMATPDAKFVAKYVAPVAIDYATGFRTYYGPVFSNSPR